MKGETKEYNSAFYIVLFLLITTLFVSGWLLQDNGTWDFFVFAFISLPVNIILLLILIFMKKTR
ncbi:hypothetical protein [Pontimicrobium sp. IMCC45349]|uniref:hypothetical protein n=1 Tax=Pontimicrobium sp. IMCC45349 TaxID=3391574 RepID=UPI0039A00E43